MLAKKIEMDEQATVWWQTAVLQSGCGAWETSSTCFSALKEKHHGEGTNSAGHTLITPVSCGQRRRELCFACLALKSMKSC
jgi:hypothetical protein